MKKLLLIPKPRLLVAFQQSRACSQTSEKSAVDSPSNLKSFEDVPGPKRLPIIGNTLDFNQYMKKQKSHLYFRDLSKKYGKIVRVNLGPQPTLLLFDPDLISQTIANEGMYPERRSVPIMQTYVKRTKRNMMSVQNGPSWQKYRSAAQRSIKPNVLKLYVDSQAQCADDLVTWLENHGNNNPDVKYAFMRYSADANAVLTFDKKIGFLKNAEDPELVLFLNSIKQFMDLIGQSVFSFPWFIFWRTKLYTDFENATNTIYRISEKYIEQVRMELENLRNKDGELDIAESDLTVLKCLLQDERMTNTMITDLMAGMLFAGVDQVSQALIWMFWLIGKSPEKQQKLFEEIETNIGSSPITAAILGHLPYLKACVKESFRCVPNFATGTGRVLPLDTEIGGYLIPKGTTVMFCNNTLSMSEEYFPNAEKFLPERWLDGPNDPQKQRQMALCVLPFGIGKRNCLGRRFSEQEIHLAAVKILQNFQIEVTDDCRDAKPTYTTFAVPDRPIKFTFTKR